MAFITDLLSNKALQKHLCPACTRRLDKQNNREALNPEIELVTCNCGEQYHYDRLHREYSTYTRSSTVGSYA